MSARARAWRWTLLVVAAAYLGVMAIAGAMPRQKQLIEYEARGVLHLEPRDVTRVNLRLGEATLSLVRDSESGAWRNETDAGALSANASSQLDTALQILHASAPVKVMEREELAGADTQAFGLDGEAPEIALYRGAQRVLQVRFGRLNPEGYLQYMRAEGDARVYLMSRFVGTSWNELGTALHGKAASTQARNEVAAPLVISPSLPRSAPSSPRSSDTTQAASRPDPLRP